MGLALPHSRRTAARRAAQLASLVLFLGSAASAAPGAEQSARAQLAAESRGPAWMRWSDAAARPKFVHGAFALPEGDRELGVRRFLARHAAAFGLDAAGTELELSQSREGQAGTYWRFRQRLDGLPVFGGEVVALTRDGGPGKGAELGALNLAQRDLRRPDSLTPRIDGASALEAARVAIGVAPAQLQRSEVALGIDPEPPAALAYRVRFDTEQPPGAWEALVDAQDGSVRSWRNRIQHATGTGMVFDPNPVASTGNTSLVDGNDATTAALDAARLGVALPRLDGSGFLRGSYVDARPKTAAQRAQSALLAFDFDRSADAFNEVMAYFHLDRAQARIQSLGFTDVNNRVQVAITDFKDPNFDNSQYSPSTLEIGYGRGGVDDAEDADIVLHEYGHSIQDNQVPGFGGGDEGAMGEGFGDYLAASFSDVLSPENGDASCLAEWDSVSYSATGCLRRLDGNKHYPEFADGEVHDDGEMWSAALFKARAVVGADTMDRLVIEAHFLLSASETFQAAADAIVSTDQTLNGGAHLAALNKSFVAQGVSRELSPPAPLTAVVDSVPISVDNPRGAGGRYVPLLDDTQTVSQPGAAALRLHFETIETELDPSCLDGACDNIYLYDADGRLHQILNGTKADLESVAIPGDTVKVRLVSDVSVVFSGYHIDRVDVLADDKVFGDGFETPD